jgi:hypothetical protein
VKRRKRLAHDGVDIAAQPVAQARERFRLRVLIALSQSEPSLLYLRRPLFRRICVISGDGATSFRDAP